MQNITQSRVCPGNDQSHHRCPAERLGRAQRRQPDAAPDNADIAPYHDNFHQQPRYIPLSQPMPLLANTPFIVTGSGKFFRNVQLDPAANLGIVKSTDDGAGYHILWG